MPRSGRPPRARGGRGERRRDSPVISGRRGVTLAPTRGYAMRPVLGYHVIFSAYGFWLPNDPRESWSEFVGAWELFLAGGKATTTDETCSLAHRPHDRRRRLAAKRVLKLPPVRFTGVQARAVGRGFAGYAAESGLPVWACSILPEHVHLVTGRFRLSVEQV